MNLNQPNQIEFTSIKVSPALTWEKQFELQMDKLQKLINSNIALIKDETINSKEAPKNK